MGFLFFVACTAIFDTMWLKGVNNSSKIEKLN
uniref:Uncharacterized protein n=1 Tax=Anguilla anguilla TaxID=7936 RepID=A0A0E9RYM5_ANGAN